MAGSGLVLFPPLDIYQDLLTSFVTLLVTGPSVKCSSLPMGYCLDKALCTEVSDQVVSNWQFSKV